mmetsp:Transcript_24993/g.41221  ORF Transcript_24993/g.41221 Transcript_24993/m.41221 type:complete len:366 (-) Transcript_24993:522-1619(-)
MLFVCASVFILFVPINITLVNIATKPGAIAVLQIVGLVRVLPAAINHFVLRAGIIVIVRLTMFGALEEAAIPHDLTDLLLLGNRDTIMLFTTLILLICSARIVKMTIITPVQPFKGVAVPTVIALTVLRTLEDTAAPFVLTALGLDFKRFALVLGAAPILFFFRALAINFVTSPTIGTPSRNGGDGGGIRRPCGGFGEISIVFLLTLVPIALQPFAHFNLRIIISHRLAAASRAFGYSTLIRSLIILPVITIPTIRIPGRDRSRLVSRPPSITILVTVTDITVELLAETLLLIKCVILLLVAASRFEWLNTVSKPIIIPGRHHCRPQRRIMVRIVVATRVTWDFGFGPPSTATGCPLSRSGSGFL